MEIIVPGSESVHTARNIWELADRPARPSDSVIIPVGDRREREAQLVDAAITELGLDALSSWIDPASGEYEILAPEGFEFVMRGKFQVWRPGDVPPESSEELFAEEHQGSRGRDDHYITPVSEFRGPRISLELNYQPVNLLQSSGTSDWQLKHQGRSSDGDRPRLRIQVKAPVDVKIFTGRLVKLPFNLDGRPEPMHVPLPDREIYYETTMSEGQYGAVTIELVERAVPQQLTIPEVESMTDPDELWLPDQGMGMTYAEFKEDDPRMAAYMAWKLEGTDQDVIDYHRRVYNSPFTDDPVARAKDLMWGGYTPDRLDKDVAGIIANMADGDEKEFSRKLFELAASNAGLIEVTEAERARVQRELDDEPF